MRVRVSASSLSAKSRSNSSNVTSRFGASDFVKFIDAFQRGVSGKLYPDAPRAPVLLQFGIDALQRGRHAIGALGKHIGKFPKARCFALYRLNRITVHSFQGGAGLGLSSLALIKGEIVDNIFEGGRPQGDGVALYSRERLTLRVLPGVGRPRAGRGGGGVRSVVARCVMAASCAFSRAMVSDQHGFARAIVLDDRLDLGSRRRVGFLSSSFWTSPACLRSSANRTSAVVKDEARRFGFDGRLVQFAWQLFVEGQDLFESVFCRQYWLPPGVLAARHVHQTCPDLSLPARQRFSGSQ